MTSVCSAMSRTRSASLGRPRRSSPCRIAAEARPNAAHCSMLASPRVGHALEDRGVVAERGRRCPRYAARPRRRARPATTRRDGRRWSPRSEGRRSIGARPLGRPAMARMNACTASERAIAGGIAGTTRRRRRRTAAQATATGDRIGVHRRDRRGCTRTWRRQRTVVGVLEGRSPEVVRLRPSAGLVEGDAETPTGFGPLGRRRARSSMTGSRMRLDTMGIAGVEPGRGGGEPAPPSVLESGPPA